MRKAPASAPIPKRAKVPGAGTLPPPVVDVLVLVLDELVLDELVLDELVLDEPVLL